LSRRAKEKAKKHESFDVAPGGGAAGAGLMVPQNQIRRHSTGNPEADSAAVAAAAAAFKKKRGSAADIRGGDLKQQGNNDRSGAFMRARANQSASANLGTHPHHPQHPHAKGFVHTHSESQIQPPGGGRQRYDNDPASAAAAGHDQMLSAPQGMGSARGRRGSCPKIAAAVASRNGSSEELDTRDWQNNIRRGGNVDSCKPYQFALFVSVF
jgi:hypothetical protein